MGTATIKSVALRGVEGVPVDVRVEVDEYARPGFRVYGISDAAAVRVRAALAAIGSVRRSRVTIFVSPESVGDERLEASAVWSAAGGPSGRRARRANAAPHCAVARPPEGERCDPAHGGLAGHRRRRRGRGHPVLGG